MESIQEEDRAEGVLVVTAWAEADGRLVARMTVSGADGEPTVSAMSGSDEVIAAVAEWLASLRPRPIPPA